VRICVFTLFLIVTAASTAQTAKVIALTPEEARERAELQKQSDEIAAKIKAFDEAIRERYTWVKQGDKDAGNEVASGTFSGFTTGTTACFHTLGETPEVTKQRDRACAEWTSKHPSPPPAYYRRGWENGINYTDDFRYIVPVEAPKYSAFGNGCVYSSPVIDWPTIRGTK
jgi:hypothetical protein